MQQFTRLVVAILSMAALEPAARRSQAADRPTPGDLLAAYEKAVEPLSRVRIESLTEAAIIDKDKERPVGGAPSITSRDGDLWKVDVSGDRGRLQILFSTQPGKSELIRASATKPTPAAPEMPPRMMAFRDKHAIRIWNELRAHRVLFARMTGDLGQPLWSIMAAASSLELQPGTEVIDGHDTYVLRSKGKYGEHKVWLDPSSGGLPRRIEVRKTAGDLFDEEQLGTRDKAPSTDSTPKPGEVVPLAARRDVTLRIDHVVLEKRNDVFLMTGFDLRETFVNAGGQKTDAIYRTKVSEFEIFSKPWLERPLKFDIPIPNGTRVGIVEDAPLEFNAGPRVRRGS